LLLKAKKKERMLNNVSYYAESEKPSYLHLCGQFDLSGGTLRLLAQGLLQKNCRPLRP
jgi:hypothetical protein